MKDRGALMAALSLGLPLALIVSLAVAQAQVPSSSSSPPFTGWLVLDGQDDYAQGDDHSELDVGESLTVEAWVNFQSFYSANIVSKHKAYELNGDYREALKLTCIGFGIWTSSVKGEGMELCDVQEFPFGWYHVAGVFNATTRTGVIYLNGQPIIDHEFSFSTINNSEESLWVGRGFTPGVLTGGVDELRISSVARYDGNAFAVPTEPFVCDEHTLGLWHFDEFVGSTIFHDACGDDNVLTGYNGAHIEGSEQPQRVFLPLVAR